MYKFDFKMFLLENRKSLNDLAAELKIPYKTLSNVMKRGTIKPRLLKEIELHFGDCTKYLIINNNHHYNSPIAN